MLSPDRKRQIIHLFIRQKAAGILPDYAGGQTLNPYLSAACGLYDQAQDTVLPWRHWQQAAVVLPFSTLRNRRPLCSIFKVNYQVLRCGSIPKIEGWARMQ